MIILGDVAIPNKTHVDKFIDVCKRHFLETENILINLEGLISDKVDLKSEKSIIFNDIELVPKCKENLNSNLIFCLANNHTLDIPHEFPKTKQILESNDYNYIGVSDSSNNDNDCCVFYENNLKVYLLNYCWDFLLYHQKNPSHNVKVQELNFKKTIKRIKEIKTKEDGEYKIIVYIHWSYDLEIIPIPYFRTFSKELIDIGVNLVAGCHSHCIQGIERYKHGFIAHGIGNFYFPNGVFINKKLVFPKMSAKTIALEYIPQSNQLLLHWFEGVGLGEDYNLNFLKSENFYESIEIFNYCKYSGCNDDEYVKYYRKNRRKKFLVPVFKNHKSVVTNKVKMYFLILRANLARKLAQLNLRKWQN